MADEPTEAPAEDWRDVIGDVYRQRRSALENRVLVLREEISQLQKQADALIAEIRDLDTAARVFGVGAVTDDSLTAVGQTLLRVSGQMAASGKRAFKDVALGALESAYPKPLKAGRVREIAEQELQEKFHPKTAGMTLYRLSQDGLVRREGHNWFFVPESKRKHSPDEENPGSAPSEDDPGSLFK